MIPETKLYIIVVRDMTVSLKGCDWVKYLIKLDTKECAIASGADVSWLLAA